MDEEWVLELMVDVEGMAQSKVTVQGGMEMRDKSMKNVPLGSCPLTLPPLATSRTHRLLCQPRGSPSLLCLSQVYPQAPCHAEACFLSWFRDQNLHPEEHYRVTWFLSWSPCPTCAEDVVEFLEEYRNVTLSIYTARLYYFCDPDFQEGLHKQGSIWTSCPLKVRAEGAGETGLWEGVGLGQGVLEDLECP